MQEDQFSVTVDFNGRKVYCVVMRGDRSESITYIVCALGLKNYYDVFEICLSEDSKTDQPVWQQQHDPVGDEPVEQAFIEKIGKAIVGFYS